LICVCYDYIHARAGMMFIRSGTEVSRPWDVSTRATCVSTRAAAHAVARASNRKTLKTLYPFGLAPRMVFMGNLEFFKAPFA